jgi:hypothetical protein
MKALIARLESTRELPAVEAHAELTAIGEAAQAKGLDLYAARHLGTTKRWKRMKPVLEAWLVALDGAAHATPAMDKVLKAIRATGHATVGEIVETTDLEEKTVRNAIDKLRHQREERLVSFQKAVWTAEALDAKNVPIAQFGPRGIWKVDREKFKAQKRQNGSPSTVQGKGIVKSVGELQARLKAGDAPRPNSCWLGSEPPLSSARPRLSSKRRWRSGSSPAITRRQWANSTRSRWRGRRSRSAGPRRPRFARTPG